MTKFVAALFLPLVLVGAILWQPNRGARVRHGWKDWLLPVALIAVVTVPWFVYETHRFGREFWSIIFGTHVFTRFTGILDPTHIHPWHHYFTATWHELSYSGSVMLCAAGFVRLAWAAWRNEPPLARLMVLWGLLPLTLMSFGTSKLLHYAYPFMPPIGLAAGFVFASALKSLDGRFGAWLTRQVTRLVPRRGSSWTAESSLARRFLVIAALIFFAVAIWTAISGPLKYEVGGLAFFRNSSVIRPAFFGVFLLWIAGFSMNLLKLCGALALAFFLPLGAYADKIQHIATREDHPLRALRDCMESVQAAGMPPKGVLAASGNILHHSYYYYLWRLGPWTIAPTFLPQQVIDRLTTVDGPSPVILQHADFDTLKEALAGRPDMLAILKDDAVRYDENIAFLLPGPYAPCVAPVLAAGGRTMW